MSFLDRLSMPVRMAVAEEKIDDLEQEAARTRQRLHDLESDRATLKLLMRQVTDMGANVETIARRAALEALNLGMEHRDELGHRRWTLRLQWVAAGVGIGGLVAAIVAHFA